MDYDNIDLVKGDVTNAEFLNRAFDGVVGVFHVAAFAKPWAKDPQIYYDINEAGTKNVCEACIANGVKRLVYTSSAGTHGPQQGAELVNEDTWPKQYFTDYEQSKFNGREVALSYQEKGLEVIVVSPARVYGENGVSDSNVPVRMLSLFLQNKFGFVPTDGTGIGSYVFLEDIVDGHIIAMEKAPSGEEYLLGGENLSYVEFFEVIKKVTGKNYPVIKIPYPISLGIGKTQHFMAENFGIEPMITTPWVRRYLKNWGIDTSKIQALGYKVTPLEVGMKRVMELL